MKKAILIMGVMLALWSCSSGPEPLQYGEESCSFCKMKIMDHRFGAEIVTRKGKVIKFDAIECMLQYVGKGYIKASDIGQYYVVDIAHPGQLLPSDKAFFMESKVLSSPMGGNLCAAENPAMGRQLCTQYAGSQQQWPALMARYNITK